MREILIDVTRLLGRFMKGRLPTGVDRVGLAYVQHYGPHARAVVRWAGRSFVLPEAESGQLFQWLLTPSGLLNASIPLAKALLYGRDARRVEGCFLFNTGHSGLELAAYPGMLRKQKVKPLFVVHDLIPITHPEYCRAGERERHVVRMKNVLGLASGVITNSQATLKELASFADSTGQPMPPAVAALLAPGMSGISPGSRPMAPPYFVILSTIEPRKNHWLLLHLWRGLVERLGEKAPRLVVIGQRGWECENVVDMLERCERLKGFVIEKSSCPDAELVTYLCHAQALLFPSFAEGYGIPLVEALALGVPVIASDLAVFREVAGEIPEYIDPLDGKRWSELIMEYARPDSPPRTAQLARIGGFKAPTWAEHFARVDALLEQLSESVGHE
ncbi:MAG: glycosyltransferase family 1 protein [Gallionella sp.]|nr:glycosyltransferase family 1 protein [Gallionella sp.]